MRFFRQTFRVRGDGHEKLLRSRGFQKPPISQGEAQGKKNKDSSH